MLVIAKRKQMRSARGLDRQIKPSLSRRLQRLREAIVIYFLFSQPWTSLGRIKDVLARYP